MAKQLEMMYEGKAKQVFATDDPTLAVIHYKDDATAFNGLKKGTIVGKGVVNNLVSNHLFKMLEANGVKTHLVEQLNERDSVVPSPRPAFRACRKGTKSAGVLLQERRSRRSDD